MRMSLQDEYFEWMYHIVSDNRFAKENSYRKLLMHLHKRTFYWLLKYDANRSEDGKDLRWRFSYFNDVDIGNELDGPCSVFEMLLALAIRCEESIMEDPEIGNRTGQWFWSMINNLGLGSEIDSRYDELYVDKVLDRFMERKFKPDGRGGIFTIKNCEYDLRDVEFWTQMLWYLDSRYIT